MARKPAPPPSGAPEWVLTYGDMMSLLLCFFIMLVALSEIKEEDKYKSIATEIQKAFGIQGGASGTNPTDAAKNLIKVLESMASKSAEAQTSSAIDPGTDGRRPQVTDVRKGKRFIVGNRITFATRSAVLSGTAQQDLRVIADMVRGYNNILELRGHAASMELAGQNGLTLEDMSFARAKAVMAFLTEPEQGISPDRIRLVACADREPLVRRVYDQARQTPNRRVEVIVTEGLVDEFRQLETD